MDRGGRTQVSTDATACAGICFNRGQSPLIPSDRPALQRAFHDTIIAGLSLRHITVFLINHREAHPGPGDVFQLQGLRPAGFHTRHVLAHGARHFDRDNRRRSASGTELGAQPADRLVRAGVDAVRASGARLQKGILRQGPRWSCPWLQILLQPRVGIRRCAGESAGCPLDAEQQ